MKYGDIRVRDTGQYRFRLKNRWFKEPVIILQKELIWEKNIGFSVINWEEFSRNWRDVSLEDLSTMDLTKLISPRDSDGLPICFKPIRRWPGWSLMLQICDGAYADNMWRPARMQDLTIKDGRIQGGLGLVSRGK